MAAFLRQSAQFPHLIDSRSAGKSFSHCFDGALAIPLGQAAAFRFFQYFVGRFKPGCHLPQHRIDTLGFNPFRQSFPHFVQQRVSGKPPLAGLAYMIQQGSDLVLRTALCRTKPSDRFSILD